MMRSESRLLWITSLIFSVFAALSSGLLNGADKGDNTIHVAIVACGSKRAAEALTSIRSTVLSALQPERLYFHIFHDPSDQNDVIFSGTLTRWQEQQGQTSSFSFRLHHSKLPTNYTNLFAPCACQRLFLHEELSFDRVIYIDSDTIVLDDMAVLWDEFANFGPSTVAALAPEHPTSHPHPYYKEEARHPYYNTSSVDGLNSGVMLLNLRALRKSPWNTELEKYRQTYDLNFHDQDLLNIFFAHHPQKLNCLSCRWNYRSDDCYFHEHHCPESEAHFGVLHGSRGSFHKTSHEEWSVVAFAMVYKVFSSNFGSVRTSCDLRQSLEQDIDAWLDVVQQEDLTNNCQAVALPNILQSMIRNCRLERLMQGQAS